MKNENGKNNDKHNYYHHVGTQWNWDDYSRWYAQIAGDCVDLNTENPAVSNYLVDCYGKFIKMGVDGFRIDTSGHISRLTFNKAFIPQFLKLAEENKAARNGGDFFMYGEVCARERNVVYRGHDNCSPYFYTWKESKDYPWDYSETSWDDQVIVNHERGTHTNIVSQDKQGVDYGNSVAAEFNSKNAFLNGNEYHKPDMSKYSGFSVIDFPMHWNFRSTREAWGVRGGDKYYNDATWNVTYVDSHDYAPDGAPENQRFAQSQGTWASNLDLMFTFRGIPCLYYGSEIEFKKGCTIDKGADLALKNSGRAYFGGYIEGNVKVTDFAEYTGANGNVAATLAHPLAIHIQRLNKIRAAVPALRKGQYSTDGCSGEANMRIYVLSTDKTPAPGKIGTDGKYLYASGPVNITAPAYDGNQEPEDTETQRPGQGPVNPGTVTPIWQLVGEHSVYFIDNDTSNPWSRVYVYTWNQAGVEHCGKWSGAAMTRTEIDGKAAWGYVFPDDCTIKEGDGIIFNCPGAGQTGNLAFVEHGIFDRSGSKGVLSTVGIDGFHTEIVSNADVRWFNMQGQPVAEPQRGEIYIRVAGNKATKVIY